MIPFDKFKWQEQLINKVVRWTYADFSNQYISMNIYLIYPVENFVSDISNKNWGVQKGDYTLTSL